MNPKTNRSLSVSLLIVSMLVVLFANCAIAGKGGGFVDTDGDGIADGADQFPFDPNNGAGNGNQNEESSSSSGPSPDSSSSSSSGSSSSSSSSSSGSEET
ncbi:MAG: hypothetical protein IPM23_09845 [Candidatus Melainabacteria bacterium]|nr:hypothetical protein [Candidatus Melainabacteria bacterium]